MKEATDFAIKLKDGTEEVVQAHQCYIQEEAGGCLVARFVRGFGRGDGKEFIAVAHYNMDSVVRIRKLPQAAVNKTATAQPATGGWLEGGKVNVSFGVQNVLISFRSLKTNEELGYTRLPVLPKIGEFITVLDSAADAIVIAGRIRDARWLVNTEDDDEPGVIFCIEE